MSVATLSWSYTVASGVGVTPLAYIVTRILSVPLRFNRSIFGLLVLPRSIFGLLVLPPAEIKEVQNNRHVWRGLIDGDGSLGVYERKNLNGTIRRVPYISVTGSKIVCLQFRSFLEKELCEPMPPSVIFYKKSYLFMLSDHRAVKAIKLLYSNCTIALERKLQKALEIMEEFQYADFDKHHTEKTID